jgi:hypothetical protein
MKLLIPSIAIASLLMTSCSTTESFVNDDIYSVRPSELPIGESLTDETSYASFKSRKLGQTNDRMTYADEMAMRNRENCLEQWNWYEGCGCTYREWAMYSRYSNNNRFSMNRRIYWNHRSMGYGFAMSNMYPYGISYGMYSGNMYPYYHNPYIIMDPWYGGYGYGYGSSWHYPSYGYNPYSPYGYYGYGYGGYGYGGNMNGWGNSSNHSGVSSNVIRGPRGTSTGYSNPSGRAVSHDKVQVGKVNTPTSAKGNLSSTRAASTVKKPIDGTSVMSRVNTPTYSRDNVNGNLTPTTSSRPNVERASSAPSRSSSNPTVSSAPARNNSEFQRTYPSRTASPSGNMRPESETGRSNTISTPQRTSTPNNGSYSSPSRGSSNSGMGSSSSGSSSGGGRSGASSSSSSGTGRR